MGLRRTAGLMLAYGRRHAVLPWPSHRQYPRHRDPALTPAGFLKLTLLKLTLAERETGGAYSLLC